MTPSQTINIILLHNCTTLAFLLAYVHELEYCSITVVPVVCGSTSLNWVSKKFICC